MNETAILHIVFALSVGAGILVQSLPLRIGLFAFGGACFVAGVVLARRGDNNPDYAADS
ncbi:hypothetical protein [Halovenus carboxidivorans]|uniref:hypothetical protein n=1 Tax=Halovenus carboxidivorans TaxID=2692199 RepID=UPI00191687A5|nr:hypothetical protein [Halovenus carboxidivorans]